MTWRWANDEPLHGILWLTAHNRIINYCSGFNEETGQVCVDVAEPVGGKQPTIAVPIVTQVLALRGGFQLHEEAPKPDGWIYWTGEGWIDRESQLTTGPLARIVSESREPAR